MQTLALQEELRYNILGEDESIFCFGTSVDAERIRQGKWEPASMTGQEGHAFVGSTYRLLALGDGDGRAVPEIAYQGFMWCGHGRVHGLTPVSEYEIPGVWRHTDDRFLFEIRPHTMDNVYVADHQAFVGAKEELWRDRPATDRVSDAEMRPVYTARAQTIVPITDYDGSFGQPIILAKWDTLSYDEIQLVSGPWATLERGKLRYW